MLVFASLGEGVTLLAVSSRYVVIPKLVGYMAPKPQLEDDNVIDSLFASLFGKTPGAAEAEGQGQQQTEQQQQ